MSSSAASMPPPPPRVKRAQSESEVAEKDREFSPPKRTRTDIVLGSTTKEQNIAPVSPPTLPSANLISPIAVEATALREEEEEQEEEEEAAKEQQQQQLFVATPLDLAALAPPVAASSNEVSLQAEAADDIRMAEPSSIEDMKEIEEMQETENASASASESTAATEAAEVIDPAPMESAPAGTPKDEQVEEQQQDELEPAEADAIHTAMDDDSPKPTLPSFGVSKDGDDHDHDHETDIENDDHDNHHHDIDDGAASTTEDATMIQNDSDNVEEESIAAITSAAMEQEEDSGIDESDFRGVNEAEVVPKEKQGGSSSEESAEQESHEVGVKDTQVQQQEEQPEEEDAMEYGPEHKKLTEDQEDPLDAALMARTPVSTPSKDATSSSESNGDQDHNDDIYQVEPVSANELPEMSDVEPISSFDAQPNVLTSLQPMKPMQYFDQRQFSSMVGRPFVPPLPLRNLRDGNSVQTASLTKDRSAVNDDTKSLDSMMTDNQWQSEGTGSFYGDHDDVSSTSDSEVRFRGFQSFSGGSESSYGLGYAAMTSSSGTGPVSRATHQRALQDQEVELRRRFAAELARERVRVADATAAQSAQAAKEEFERLSSEAVHEFERQCATFQKDATWDLEESRRQDVEGRAAELQSEWREQHGTKQNMARTLLQATMESSSTEQPPLLLSSLSSLSSLSLHASPPPDSSSSSSPPPSSSSSLSSSSYARPSRKPNARDVEVQALLRALTDSWEEERSAMQRNMEFRFQEEVAVYAAASATSTICDDEGQEESRACDCRRQLESYKNEIRKEIEQEIQRESAREDVMSKLAWDRDRIGYEDALKDLQYRLDAATTASQKST